MSTVLCFMPPRPADWIKWDMPSLRLEDTTSWQKPLVFSTPIRERMFWGDKLGRCLLGKLGANRMWPPASGSPPRSQPREMGRIPPSPHAGCSMSSTEATSQQEPAWPFPEKPPLSKQGHQTTEGKVGDKVRPGQLLPLIQQDECHVPPHPAEMLLVSPGVGPGGKPGSSSQDSHCPTRPTDGAPLPLGTPWLWAPAGAAHLG